MEKYSSILNIKFAIVAIFIVCGSQLLLCQNEECHLVKSTSGEIYTVDSFDLICLASSSQKEKTLIFTFGTWCKPCKYKLPDAIKLAKDYDLQFYVLLLEYENSKRERSAIEYLDDIKKTYDFEFDTFILKDENGEPDKKYRQFLKQITPPQFENINGMSKFIIVDKSGEVLMVTNSKDNKGNNWKDASKMIEERIVPILNQL